MRWDNLFDDLESQLEHELTAEDIDLQAEEERLRLGRMSMHDRLHALRPREPGAADRPFRVALASGRIITVALLSLGKDWFCAEMMEATSRRRQCIVPLASISGLILDRQQIDVSVRSPRAAEPASALSSRLSLVFVLRDLCRRRRGLELDLSTDGHGSQAIHGTIDRVGRDHIDVAIHERGSPRRESEVVQYRVVPLARITLIRL